MHPFKQKYPNWKTWDTGAHNRWEINTMKESWTEDLGLTKGQWKNFLKEMSYLICDEIVNNPEGFILPYKMGLLIVSGSQEKPKNHKYSTKDKTIRHRNNHTGGLAYGCKYLYGMGRGKFSLSHIYKYRTSVPLRTRLNKKIMSGVYKFYEFENFNDVKRLGVPAHIQRKNK